MRGHLWLNKVASVFGPLIFQCHSSSLFSLHSMLFQPALQKSLNYHRFTYHLISNFVQANCHHTICFLVRLLSPASIPLTTPVPFALLPSRNGLVSTTPPTAHSIITNLHRQDIIQDIIYHCHSASLLAKNYNNQQMMGKVSNNRHEADHSKILHLCSNN